MEGRTVSSKGNPQIVVNSDSPSLKLNKSPSFKTSPSDEGIDVSNENKIQVSVCKLILFVKQNEIKLVLVLLKFLVNDMLGKILYVYSKLVGFNTELSCLK